MGLSDNNTDKTYNSGIQICKNLQKALPFNPTYQVKFHFANSPKVVNKIFWTVKDSENLLK